MTCPCGATSQPSETLTRCYFCASPLTAIVRTGGESAWAQSWRAKAAEMGRENSPKAAEEDGAVVMKGLAMFLDALSLCGIRGIKVHAGWQLMNDILGAMGVPYGTAWFHKNRIDYAVDVNLAARAVRVTHE